MRPADLRSGWKLGVPEPSALNDILGDALLRGGAGYEFQDLAEELVVGVGNDGTVCGAGAMSMTRADGKRQMSVAMNLMRWNKLDISGSHSTIPLMTRCRLFTNWRCGSGKAP